MGLNFWLKMDIYLKYYNILFFEFNSKEEQLKLLNNFKYNNY